MRYLFVLFLTISSVSMLMSYQWKIEGEYSLYSCSTKKFPTGGPGPFMDCSTVNPLVDIMCAGCHGQNPVTDGSGNILSYDNIIDGATMNVFKVLDGTTEITEYIPGHEYTVELNMNTIAARKGFDVTICASTGDNGTFTQMVSEPGVQVFNSSSYILATHTNNTGTDLWRWKWVAPSVDPGPLRFDVLTLKDNSPISSNDSLYVSHTQLTPLPASLNSLNQLGNALEFWVDNADHNLVLKYKESIGFPLSVEIYTSAGNRILTEKIGKQEGGEKVISLPSGKEAGVYFVRFSDNHGQSINRKIFLGSDY